MGRCTCFCWAPGCEAGGEGLLGGMGRAGVRPIAGGLGRPAGGTCMAKAISIFSCAIVVSWSRRAASRTDWGKMKYSHCIILLLSVFLYASREAPGDGG